MDEYYRVLKEMELLAGVFRGFVREGRRTFLKLSETPENADLDWWMCPNVRRLKAALREAGVKPGDPVLISCGAWPFEGGYFVVVEPQILEDIEGEDEANT